MQQAQLQQRLMNKYGNHICLLDGTYKTTKYLIPLFSVVVKTNSNYQAVASFAVQDETTAAITEALGILKNWNPSLSLKYFMVDNWEEEITSIETVFPGKASLSIFREIFKMLSNKNFGFVFFWLFGDTAVVCRGAYLGPPATSKMQSSVTLVNVTLENE